MFLPAPSPIAMRLAPTLLSGALTRARTDWLSGDPEAWERYTECLAHLQAHLAEVQSPDRPAAPTRRAPGRPADRRPASRVRGA